MARSQSPRTPKAAQLTPEQKREAIPRLKKRIEELRAFKAENIGDASDPGVRTLEQAIEKTLVGIFGTDTVDYERHREAAQIGPFSCGIPWQDGPGQGARLIEFVSKDLRRSEANLQGIVSGFEEDLDFAKNSERKTGKSEESMHTSSRRVFIGHGRSLLWRELKDFLEGRLRLPWDEFNRVTVAGVSNIARLSEMLDAAAIALLLLTGEDEVKDGVIQARMNVVHEAGLFQGKLGFTKAIILLEEGCEEFGNIQGLGQIRFPKGNLAGAFEEVRRVLEREGILSVNTEALK